MSEPATVPREPAPEALLPHRRGRRARRRRAARAPPTREREFRSIRPTKSARVSASTSRRWIENLMRVRGAPLSARASPIAGAEEEAPAAPGQERGRGRGIAGGGQVEDPRASSSRCGSRSKRSSPSSAPRQAPLSSRGKRLTAPTPEVIKRAPSPCFGADALTLLLAVALAALARPPAQIARGGPPGSAALATRPRPPRDVQDRPAPADPRRWVTGTPTSPLPPPVIAPTVARRCGPINPSRPASAEPSRASWRARTRCSASGLPWPPVIELHGYFAPAAGALSQLLLGRHRLQRRGRPVPSGPSCSISRGHDDHRRERSDGGHLRPERR